MKHRAWVGWVGVMGALFLAAGCSGSSNDDDPDETGGGVGTPTCQQWQGAICNFAERCGGDAVTCREQAPSIACLSDAEAQRCAAELQSSDCTTLPVGCDFFDIADPAPAIEKCNAFIETLCNRSEECEPGTRADCITAANESLPCALAIGAKPEYDQCLSEIADIECTAPSSPASCQGVILLER